MRSILVWGLLVASLLSDARAQPGRITYNFNPGWLLYTGDTAGAESPQFDDGSWQAITLPHAFNEDDAFKKAIQDLTTGVAWYRKHFRIPKSDRRKKIYIEFEGIRQGGEFWLNGHPLGLSENGVMAFGFDLTPWLRPDSDNAVAGLVFQGGGQRTRARQKTRLPGGYAGKR